MYSPTEARYFHELLVTTFGNADVQPTYVQHVSQIHTALALVQVRPRHRPGAGHRGPAALRRRDVPRGPAPRTESR